MVNALGDDGVLVLDLKACPHSPRLLQELEVLLTLQPKRMIDEDTNVNAGPVLYWMDIASLPIDSERTWIPGVPVMIKMTGVSLGIQAAADAKRMVENGACFKQSR